MTLAPIVDPDEIVGRDPALLAALRLADRAAAGTHAVLILGETGTGKELIARRIHRVSERPGPIVDVNCAALPRDIADSLLFGHRRGAFTGAVEATTGFIRQARAGTLYLDELASLPPEIQGKLLRVLETREVRAIGEARGQAIDFRAVAAADEGLETRVERGEFRLDLYHRLATIVVRLPPLRKRGSDVIALARHLADRAEATLAADAEPVLRAHPWPGNIRELRATIERALLLGNGQDITAADIGACLERRRPASARSRKQTTAEDRAQRFIAVCAAEAWDIPRIVKHLGISRATFYRRLKTLGITLPSGQAVSVSRLSHEKMRRT